MLGVRMLVFGIIQDFAQSAEMSDDPGSTEKLDSSGKMTYFVNYDSVPNSSAALLRTSLLVCPPDHLVPARCG